MRYYSPKDRQSTIRTKVPDDVYDRVEAYGIARDMTLYQAARDLITKGLDTEARRKEASA